MAEGFDPLGGEEESALYEVVIDPKEPADLALIFGPELPRVLRLCAARLRRAGPHWSARVEELERMALSAEAEGAN